MFDAFDLAESFYARANCKWYMLQDQSLEAAKKMIAAQESSQETSPKENKRLREFLGLDYAVMQIIPGRGPAESYPKIFVLNELSNECFYMMCPVGGGIAGITNFEPPDAILLRNEEISYVTDVLFAPGVETGPSISRETAILIP